MRHPEDVHGAVSSWEARPCPRAWSSAMATILTLAADARLQEQLEVRLCVEAGACLSLTAHLGRLHSSLAVPRRRDDGIQADRTLRRRKHCQCATRRLRAGIHRGDASSLQFRFVLGDGGSAGLGHEATWLPRTELGLHGVTGGGTGQGRRWRHPV